MIPGWPLLVTVFIARIIWRPIFPPAVDGLARSPFAAVQEGQISAKSVLHFQLSAEETLTLLVTNFGEPPKHQRVQVSQSPREGEGMCTGMDLSVCAGLQHSKDLLRFGLSLFRTLEDPWKLRSG